MFDNRLALGGLVVFTLFFLVSVLEIDAWARVGGGRSMGSRGSRSYSAPRPAPAPAPSRPSPGAGQYGSPSAPAPAPLGGGGFLRRVAGGLLGGMLGGMLFRSLGFAGGTGGFGGGIGLMDIILIGALLYGIYWFLKRRRATQEAEQPAGYHYRGSFPQESGQTTPPLQAYGAAGQESDVAAGLRHIRQMDLGFDEKRFTDACMDHFFRIQGAWANRDMSSARSLLTEEMFGTLRQEVEQLRAKRQINRLENIAVRSVDVTEVWQEGGADFITVLLYANLLDYTVDETTGQVVAGSRTEPVKFNEFWTFSRPVGDNPWRLSAITQAE